MNHLSNTSVSSIPRESARMREMIPDARAVLQVCTVIGLAMGVVACSALILRGLAIVIEVGGSVSQSLLADLCRLSITDWMQVIAGTR